MNHKKMMRRTRERIRKERLQSDLDRLKQLPPEKRSRQDQEIIQEIEVVLGKRPQSRSNPWKRK